MKRNRMFKGILSILLLMVLSLSSLSTAFAAGSPITGTETNPPKAAINKTLRMPEGTYTPNASFEFTVTKVSVDGSTAAADLNTMPAIANQTISFTSADAGTTASGVKTVIKESGDILAGLTWPHAGVYQYKIKETANTYTINDPLKEWMTYSAGEYTLSVYVDNGTNGLYVSAIADVITVVDNAGQNVGDKVDPTPEISGNYSDMVFTNTYLKNNGGPDPDDSALTISKIVSGVGSNQTNKYFAFTLTLNKAATITTTPTYKVYVLNASNTVVTSTAHASAADIKNDGTNNYIEVTAGTPISINLKHGEKLSCIDTHVGTTYTVVESADQNYKGEATVIVNSASPTTVSGNFNESVSVGPNLVGEQTNSVAYENVYKTVTPTGISLSNAPFIVMIVIVAVLFIGFIVVKSRRRRA